MQDRSMIGVAVPKSKGRRQCGQARFRDRQLTNPGISTVFATNWYRFCDVHFCAFFAFFLAFCLHSVQRDAFSSCISERIFVHLKRIFAHLKALCCILSARTLLCLGVHLLCIHDAPFLDQCLMCILPAFLHFVFHDILTHSKRILCAFVPIPR